MTHHLDPQPICIRCQQAIPDGAAHLEVQGYRGCLILEADLYGIGNKVEARNVRLTWQEWRR